MIAVGPRLLIREDIQMQHQETKVNLTDLACSEFTKEGIGWVFPQSEGFNQSSMGLGIQLM